MTEREMIGNLMGIMPRTDLQRNKLFQSDSEILSFAGQNLLFTTDEFSGEDLFCEKDPYVLGYNIAAASVSDIYASGGEPLFYAHSLTVSEMFAGVYIEKFYRGIADVLKSTGAGFIGGDFGKSREWRCCVSVIGKSEKPILRSGAKPGDSIYVTGPLGGGNLQAAALKYGVAIPKIKFKLRINESAQIRKSAASCIDTSDGGLSALRMISQMSGTGFDVYNIPYLPAAKLAAKMLGMPPEMLFICECGEYELLFTSPEDNLKFCKIGKITDGSMLLNGKDISKIDISAREFESFSKYIKAVQKLCAELL